MAGAGGPRALACAFGIARHGSGRRFRIGSTSGPDGARSGSGAESARRCRHACRCTRASEQSARARSARAARSSRARSAHGHQRPRSEGSRPNADVTGNFSSDRRDRGSMRSIQRSGGGAEGGRRGGTSGGRARFLGELRAMRSIQRTAVGTEAGRRAGRSAGSGDFFRNSWPRGAGRGLFERGPGYGGPGSTCSGGIPTRKPDRGA